jgi:hypothetical protein
MSRRTKVANKNTIDTENVDTDTNEEVEAENEIKEIPDSRLYGMNLKKIPSFKLMRQTAKATNQKTIFLAHVSKSLELMAPNENKLVVGFMVLLSFSPPGLFTEV